MGSLFISKAAESKRLPGTVPFGLCRADHSDGWVCPVLEEKETMRKILVLLVGFSGLLSVASADAIQPVGGNTSGTFSNGAGTAAFSTSGDTWKIYPGTGNESSIVVTGNSFGVNNTPLTTLLATLTLANGGNGGGDNTFTADMDLTVNFTSPGGSNFVGFIDGLQLTTATGGGGNKNLNVIFGGLPAPQTFSYNGFDYTVTLNGYFDAASGGSLMTNLVSNNDGNSTVSAYLRGTITSEATTILIPSAVPEPVSIGLLLTVIAGVGLAARRKRAA